MPEEASASLIPQEGLKRAITHPLAVELEEHFDAALRLVTGDLSLQKCGIRLHKQSNTDDVANQESIGSSNDDLTNTGKVCRTTERQ